MYMLYICMYVCVYVCVYIYIYIYILFVLTYIYIYVYDGFVVRRELFWHLRSQDNAIPKELRLLSGMPSLASLLKRRRVIRRTLVYTSTRR